MWSSQDFPGKKPASSPETWGRVDGHGDLSLGVGITSNVAGVGKITTLDLFPVSIKSIAADMDLFPQQATSSSPVFNHQTATQPQGAEPLSIIYKREMHVLDVPAVKAKQIVEFANLRASGSRAIKRAVMQPMSTIYQGEVNVFIDVPDAKAKEILDFARGCAHGRYKCISSKPSNTNFSYYLPTTSLVASKYGNHATRGHLQSAGSYTASYLPLTRGPRMQRFVQMRKDRISEKAPYHKIEEALEYPAKSAPTKPCLDFGVFR